LFAIEDDVTWEMWRLTSVSKGQLRRQLSVCIGLALLSLQIVVVGQTAAAGDSSVAFDLPSQPLSEALEAYSATTGRLVLYDGHLTLGQVSTEVEGNFSPDMALRLILKNTGLVARYTAQDAFIIEPETATQVPAGRAPSAIAYAALLTLDGSERNYYGLVQANIGAALCGESLTKPGQYRLAIQLSIDKSGDVTRPRLLSSTGDAERDTAIVEAIGHVSMAEAPPIALAQPLTIVVLPRSSGGGFVCPPSRGLRRNG
jgi:hypothetical protein